MFRLWKQCKEPRKERLQICEICEMVYEIYIFRILGLAFCVLLAQGVPVAVNSADNVEMYLSYGILQEIKIPESDQCFENCIATSGCRSFSVSKEQSLCILNNVTREDVPHLGYVITNETHVSTLPQPNGFRYFEILQD